jgi:Predicted membrane protein
VLRLRLSIEEHRADLVTEALEGTGGVHRIVALNPERAGTGVVLAADVMPSVADGVMQLIRDWEVNDADYLLTRQEVVAPSPPHGHFARGGEFAWIEVMGEARTHSRPLGRYLTLMAVAAVLAAIGVITDNPILIVGAMAVSPDLLPICAACVGFVAGRFRLARRAVVTLLLGILITWGVAAGVAWGLQATGILTGDFQVHDSALHGLAHIDYSTVLVALAAGVAAMLSFETRAASAVGVAISVTTIPASAFFGVTLGLGEVSVSWGAAGVLAVNVCVLLLSGTATLAVQRRLASRSGAATAA